MKFELDTFHRNVTDEELIQDLVAVDVKLKMVKLRLTFRSYGKFGKYSASTIALRFGSWNDGLRRAYLALREEKNIPIEALFDNLKIVWIAKGKQPVFRDMAASPSQYTASTYIDRFGSWRKALEEFVASINQEQNDILSYEVEVKSHRITKRTKRDPSLSLRFLVLKRDNFCCVTCGRSPATVAGLVLEVDHISPWSAAGETIEENLQTLCFDCNRGKGART
jgi:5-methylcytosine-specific restriction endonuclease McrA